MTSRTTYGVMLTALALLVATASVPAEQSPGGQAAPAAPPSTTAAGTVPAPAAARGHWSYQPVVRPAIPAVKRNAAARTDIDRFVLAQLEAKELAFSPDADRATFIRRATLDVWGLIPSPEEVRAFVDDRSPDAYEKLVDRLLASPHYGERQARRWLDLARYADSTGFENDRTRPNMYRYRDWVIGAFNQDKPYDLFIKEQIAGDEIAPGDKQALIATGFLAGYPDNYNSRDLVQRKYQITTDITDTIGTVLLAQSVGCARCHNHKFDRLSQKEYFQLQAFFSNVIEDDTIDASDLGPIEQAVHEQQRKYDDATRELRDRRAALVADYRDQGIRYQQERYLTDSREALFKPERERTPHDVWVYRRWQNVTSGEGSVEAYLRETGRLDGTSLDNCAEWIDQKKCDTFKESRRLGQELNKFNRLRPNASKGTDTLTAMTDVPGHIPTHVLFVGDHEKRLEEVAPGFPAAIAGGETPVITPTATSTGRRTALANWIASPKNPLTARVFVNRVWAQYFGKGLVGTVSDFGRTGDRPTHPELLDYLADRFVAQGWSSKQLQREILLSSVYRQSSNERADARAVDPDNTLLASFPRIRLEAEQIRDSLLVAAGKLVDVRGGPSVFPPLPKGVTHGNLWQVSADEPDHTRRSIYVFVRRSAAYPMLDVFNMASPQQAHSRREVTTTPLQSLTLYNNDQVFQWSQTLAGRIIREAGADDRARIDRLYQILLSRRPDANETAELLSFLGTHSDVIRQKAEKGRLTLVLPIGVEDGAAAGDVVRQSAFVDLVHAVVNSSEFIYRF